jgi:hypothetical protein
MKLCLKIFAIATIAAFTYSLIGCAAPASFTYSNVGITLTQSCSDCGTIATNGTTAAWDPNNPGVILLPNGGEGETIDLTAHVTNAPSNITWQVYPTNNLGIPNPPATGSSTPVGESSVGGNTGYLNVVSGNTAIYTCGQIPIYSGAELVQAQNMQYTITYTTESLPGNGVPTLVTNTKQVTGIPMGYTLVSASVPNNPDNPSSVSTAYQLFENYNENSTTPTLYLIPHTPTSPSGLTTSVVTIPHGNNSLGVPNTYAFFGGAAGAPPCVAPGGGTTCINGLPAGSTDDTVIWEVGATTATAVQGGSTLYGTISTTGVYTAPATVPATQPVVVMASHAVPNATMYAYITVN